MRATTSNGVKSFLDAPLVVELGSRIAVGAAGSLAAQFGATVLCIEPKENHGRGKWRNRPFAMAGKSSIVIDGNDAGDRVLLERLTAAADILLLSTDVDGNDALWTGDHPDRQIVCDITAFGHTGPMAGKPMSEALVGALAGTLDTTGERDASPAFIGAPILEMSSATFATAAILAAMRVQRLHGIGQRIDVAVFDVAVTGLITFLPLHLTGREATRSGNGHPLLAPWGVYRARDGWIVICAPADSHWSRVCALMDKPELAHDIRFLSPLGRLENRALIDELMSQWVGTLSIAQCESELMRVGVACGPIVDVHELAAQPNLVHRKSIQFIVDPQSGSTIQVAASPIRGDCVTAVPLAVIPVPDADRERFTRLLQTVATTDRQKVEGRPELPSPCAGIRIVEIGHYTVAPMAGRMLGALGADVIKIESPEGDAIRKTAPLRSDGASYIFALSNTDKRGMVLNLARKDDCDTLDRLLRTADVLLENLKPGSLGKLGFGSQQLKVRHPHLVYCAVNGFGTDSVYATRMALDTVIQAMSGLMALTRSNGTPTKTGISISDNLGGQFGLIAILAGLEYRDRTGEAVHFDLSMQDTTLWATQFAWNQTKEADPGPMLIPASDGYVVCEAPIAAIHLQLVRAGYSIANGVVNATRDEVLGALDQFPIAPCLTVAEVFKHPQVAVRELLLNRPAPGQDSWLVFQPPFKLLSTPVVVRSVMSQLGHDYAIPKAAETGEK